MLKAKVIPYEPENPEKLEPETQKVKLLEFAGQLFDEIEMDSKSERIARYKKWAKNRAFYRGQQRGFWDAKKRTWVTVDIDSLTPSEQSVLVVNNLFRPMVKTLSKEISRSQVRVRANPISDSQRSILTSRFADQLIKYYQPKLLPESQRQLEGKYLLLCGNSFRYTRYDADAKGASVSKKKIGKTILPAYESAVCTKCGYDYTGEPNVTDCTVCGGVIEHHDIPAQERMGVLGYEKFNTGDLATEVVDPVEIEVWGGSSCLEESPYLRRKRLVRYEFIKKAFPFYNPKTDTKLSESAQSQWQFYDTSRTDTNVQTDTGMYEYDQLWVVPERYAGKELEEPVTFKRKIKGKWVDYTLPAGTILDKEFPSGMYICRVGKDYLGFYDEDKMEYWEHLPYDINVDGFWADGLEDAVMNQQIINEYTSLSVENVLYNASPKLIINPELINPVTVTGRPKDMILMSKNARSDKEPKQSFAQIQGMQLTNEVMMGIESSKRDMREQTGALVAFNGQGDPTLTTATAMSIARDSALALISTSLAVKAEKEQAWCWQILRFVKKYWYDQKYKFLLGKYNEAEAEAFKESALEEEINVYVESNSWMPQTNFERLQNLGAYLTAFGLPMGFLNPSVPQPIREYASQLYNVPLDFDELAPDTRIAQKRLDLAKTIAEQQIPKAMAAAQALVQIGSQQEAAMSLSAVSVMISDAMGVEEDLDDHLVFIDVYKKWLKTDEGQNANPILREAVKHTMNDHKMFFDMQQAQDAQNRMAMGQPAPQPPADFASSPTVAPAESPFTPQKVGEVKDFTKKGEQ